MTEYFNISKIQCYPTESSNRFFCEVHHKTSEGSTLDGFSTNVSYYFNKKAKVSYYFNRKDEYCELKEIDDLIQVICGNEPTFGELLMKRAD